MSWRSFRRALRLARASLVIPLAVGVVIGCGDTSDPGPGTEGPPFFSAQLDGAAWIPDTMIALAAGSPNDTSLNVTAALSLGDSAEQEVTIAVGGFHGTGTYPLAGISTPGVGAFSHMQVDSGVITGTLVFLTDSLLTGSLSISGFDRTDSIVAGRFAFEAATSPDTAGHRRLSGRFRIRYHFQPVFVP